MTSSVANRAAGDEGAQVSVACVIVTYNRKALLAECLAAVFAQDLLPLSVHVIDNASKDGTAEYLASMRAPPGSVLKATFLDENTGSAGGFSRGIELALLDGPKLVWLMDDDCIPAPDALRNLVRAQEFLGINSFVGSNVVDAQGEMANVLPVSPRPGANGYSQFALHLRSGYIEVQSLSFVSLLIPATLIFAVGLPAKEFFIWYDDVEFTRRLATVGRGYIVGDSAVRHLRAGSAGLQIWTETSAQRVALYKHYYRNGLYTARLYNGLASIKNLRFLVDAFKALVRSATEGQLRLEKVRSITIGLASGLFFRCNPVFPAAMVTSERKVSAEG